MNGLVKISGRDYHPRAGFRQFCGDHPAEAPARAGHDGDFVLEFGTHAFLSDPDGPREVRAEIVPNTTTQTLPGSRYLGPVYGVSE